MKLFELFDNPYKVEWDEEDEREIAARFKTAQGNLITVIFFQENVRHDFWEISFSIEFKQGSGRYQRTYDLSGTGDAVRVMSTVQAVIIDFIAEKRPDYFHFSSKESEPSRHKLYSRMLKRAVATVGNYQLITDYDDIPEPVADFVKSEYAHGLKGWLFGS